MDKDEPKVQGAASKLLASRVIYSANYATAIEAYWLALSHFRSILEDVEGVEGRDQYLVALRYEIAEKLQEVDALLTGTASEVGPAHRLAYALEHGYVAFGLSGAAVREAMGFDQRQVSFDVLHEAVLAFGRRVLEDLPGEIPDTMGPSGQRQVIRAMQNWSVAAAATGDDLGFLAARFEEM
ncbi:MAG: DUF6031 family protein [Phenylobacterium sp.]|uniref:DUF6031 family protein n=1 Tax=Phenylobacterium sp. TaxID=1871053 RepID=UPI0027352712|nr:DUF6031 family protein [Phenylobacterium sp.]MDP3745636.1 DUF6031 family protein [Phenylobacterium sp.]